MIGRIGRGEGIGTLTMAPTSGTAAWAPTDISGMLFWLKADAITGLSDGDDVSQWDDSSGNGNHLKQGTAANKPHYKTGILNGEPVVRGTKDLSKLTTDSNVAHGIGTGDFTWVVVGMITNNNDGYRCFMSNGAYSPGIFVHDNLRDFYWGGGNLFNKVPVNDTYYIHVLRRTSGTITLNINGVEDATTPAVATSMADAKLSAFWSGSSHIMDGDIAEIIGYDSSISDDDMSSLESHLGTKYDISV